MKNRNNWSKNLIKPEKILEIGIIILGKYTFSNILALVEKVEEVVVRQSEK